MNTPEIIGFSLLGLALLATTIGGSYLFFREAAAIRAANAKRQQQPAKPTRPSIPLPPPRTRDDNLKGVLLGIACISLVLGLLVFVARLIGDNQRLMIAGWFFVAIGLLASISAIFTPNKHTSVKKSDPLGILDEND